MRTTVRLDDDVARAVEHLRRSEGMGVSAAVNTLVRRGLATRDDDTVAFRQRSSSMGPPRVPIDDIGAALEILEDEGHRG